MAVSTSPCVLGESLVFLTRFIVDRAFRGVCQVMVAAGGTPSASLGPLFLRTGTGVQALCGGGGVSGSPVISLAPRPRVTKLNAQRVSTLTPSQTQVLPPVTRLRRRGPWGRLSGVVGQTARRMRSACSAPWGACLLYTSPSPRDRQKSR